MNYELLQDKSLFIEPTLAGFEGYTESGIYLQRKDFKLNPSWRNSACELSKPLRKSSDSNKGTNCVSASCTKPQPAVSWPLLQNSRSSKVLKVALGGAAAFASLSKSSTCLNSADAC